MRKHVLRSSLILASAIAVRGALCAAEPIDQQEVPVVVEVPADQQKSTVVVEENINDMMLNAFDSDSDDIYVKVFGKRKQKNIMMDFPVLLDGEKIGEVLVLVQNKSKKIYAQKLKEVLHDFLLDEEIQKIDKLIDKDGFVDFDKLSFLRLNTKMDMAKLALNISAVEYQKN